MRYLYFPGCKIAAGLPQYDLATRSVLGAFDIALDGTELNCCGYPACDIDFTAAVFSSARILAVAAKKELPILCPCKCCFGSLKHADYWLRHQPGLRRLIDAMLREEDLSWEPGVPVRHLLSVLVEDVGLDRVREKIRNSSIYKQGPLSIDEIVPYVQPKRATLTRHNTNSRTTSWLTCPRNPSDWIIRADSPVRVRCRRPVRRTPGSTLTLYMATACGRVLRT